MYNLKFISNFEIHHFLLLMISHDKIFDFFANAKRSQCSTRIPYKKQCNDALFLDLSNKVKHEEEGRIGQENNNECHI